MQSSKEVYLQLSVGGMMSSEHLISSQSSELGRNEPEILPPDHLELTTVPHRLP